MFGDVAPHAGDVLRRDVRGVGDYQVERAAPRQFPHRLEEVPLPERDPLPHAVAGYVAPGDRERPGRDIRGDDPRAGEPLGQRDRHAPAARAKLEHVSIRRQRAHRELFKDGEHEELGIDLRDQGVAGDLEIPFKKRRPTYNVCERRVGRRLADDLLETPPLLRAQPASGVCSELHVRHVEHGAH